MTTTKKKTKHHGRAPAAARVEAMRQKGWALAAELAATHGIHKQTLFRWARDGVLPKSAVRQSVGNTWFSISAVAARCDVPDAAPTGHGA